MLNCWHSPRWAVSLATLCAATLLAGCSSRAIDVKPRAASPAEFRAWDCGRIADELDRVQQRAADVAYTVDERAGNNIIALGVGLAVFWPALLAMRPDGLEAEDLARLKGRYEALTVVAREKQCPPPGNELSPRRAAELPVAAGERLVYQERAGARGPMSESVWQVAALKRDEIEFTVRRAGSPSALSWRQDLAGNVVAAWPGALQWQRLLKRELELGQVLAGEFGIADDPSVRARVRGQVVAVGPQTVAGRRFDAAVIELFGDVQRGEAISRLEGAVTIDRGSGVLLRLDLQSAVPGFSLQRRLARVEPAAP